MFFPASVAAAASWSLPALIVARCVQGLGAAMLLAGSLALLSALTGSASAGSRCGRRPGRSAPRSGRARRRPDAARRLARDLRFQAPVALLAFVAAFESHLHPRVEGEERGGLAANVAIALVFGALVGALFLAVLLVITVWGLAPVAGAARRERAPARGARRAAGSPAELSPRLAACSGAALLAAASWRSPCSRRRAPRSSRPRSRSAASGSGSRCRC